jgi:predicted alpha-1,6-mannanase (GH76 family)
VAGSGGPGAGVMGRIGRTTGTSIRKRRAGGRAGWIVVLTGVLLAAGLGHGLLPTHHAASAAAAGRPPSRAQAPPDGFTAAAAAAVAELNGKYSIAYTRTHLWQAASALGATIDFMQASGSRTYLSDLSSTYLAHHYAGHFLDHFYDDEGWWVRTWVKAYQLTGNKAYLWQAKSIFAAMSKGWSQACGGGVQWGQHRPYKNAITNEEFLGDAILLHDATPGDTFYAGWALREWQWFAASGMLTRSHLVVDGLRHCRPKLGSPTWTYNQGMLIGDLVGLAGMTGRKSLLRTAEQVAHAVMHSSTLSPYGILREPCDPMACGRDKPMFKGIFAENLRLLYDRVRRPAYQAYLRRNALAVWNWDRSGDVYGVSWTGPFAKPSMTAQSSALDIFITQIGLGRPGP